MAKLKGHAQKFKDWKEKPAKDFDPEADVPFDSEEDSESQDSADEKAGTEHYVAVGKSKLRRKDPVALGPQYRGARVSRAALEQQDSTGEDEEDDFEDARETREDDSEGSEHFDDPETADLEADHIDDDEEIDSDEAFGESDEEKFKDFTFKGAPKILPTRAKGSTRPTAADWMGSDEEGDEDSEDHELDEDDESDEDEDEDEDEDRERFSGLIDDEAEESEDAEEDDDDDMDGFIAGSDEEVEGEEDSEENEEESEDEQPARSKTADRSSLRDILQAGQKSVANNLSAARQSDVSKGTAVRQQQKAFDALLNVRIRMQKSLVAINSLKIVESSEIDEQSEPYEAAEAAALKLWNAIDTFRSDRQSGAGQKRKRDADAETPSNSMWEQMQTFENSAGARRRAVLENWSQRSRGTRTDDRSKKFNRPTEKSLTTRLDEELEAPERMIKRTRTPRSCAPVQVARKISEDADIYDDADFYQLLLKELVDQRTGDTSAAGGAAAATIRYTAVKEAKAKKHVDTKASKGRKMRFNVHEKLQNFMAPEDRRSWEQTAIDRLFGTLFGQRLALDEDVEDRGSDIDEDEEMGGVEVGEGLRLFAS